MAINRTPFNALVDDDGTGLTGSVWNKAAIQSVLLDPMDAMMVGGVKPIVISSTTTGTQTAWNPGIVEDTVILWNGASDLTISGIVGGAAGRRLVIINRTATLNIYINHYNAGAASGNRMSNFATSGATPLSTGGAAVYVWDPNAFGGIWVLVSHEQGAWITPPYSAANFTGNNTGAGDWTVEAGDIQSLGYRLSGRSLTFGFYLGPTTVNNAGCTALRIQSGAFGGYTIRRAIYAPFWYRDTAEAIGTVTASTAFLAVELYRLPFNNSWPATTNNTQMWGSLTFEVA